jgi:uncharacterized DUF497 family protein
MEFEWDEAKRQTVLEDRGIDFERAKEIWQGTVLEVPSRKEFNEKRFLAIGEVDGRVITVIYTWRGERKRLITARRARRHETEAYHATVGGDR